MKNFINENPLYCFSMAIGVFGIVSTLFVMNIPAIAKILVEQKHELIVRSCEQAEKDTKGNYLFEDCMYEFIKGK